MSELQPFTDLFKSRQETLVGTSKGVLTQMGIMAGVSVAALLAFSFFRPRQKKIYQPKIKYQLPPPENPLDDPDYEPPPPPISNGFFAWLSPVIHTKEQQMISNIGLDATTFLRFIRMIFTIFIFITVYAIALLVVFLIFNIKNVPWEERKDILSMLTIQHVTGSWMWPSVAASYIITFTTMFFVWQNWQAMLILRANWFRSPAYSTKIYSRTLMVTHVPKQYRTDDGLATLMGMLKGDGIKIAQEIECATIGRRLGDFPSLINDHNDAVKDLEGTLVKYLKHNKMASKRPTIRKGGFLGMGGHKQDKIDYLAKQIKFLRDKVDARRSAIDSLLRQERKSRKTGRPTAARIEGENYGFVTFKTIAEAHRIARAHNGKKKELGGAIVQLAPMPRDILWQNLSKEPAELKSLNTLGFVWIGALCTFYTIPLMIVAAFASLASLTVWAPFKWIETWQNQSSGTFALVSGVLPPALSALFGYLLPYWLRRICKYQGAPTRTRLDRAVTARYFFYTIAWSTILFSLITVIYNLVSGVIIQAGEHKSVGEIFESLKKLPEEIQGAYVVISSYWLTWLPMRGFLIFFELIQLIKLAMVSFQRVMFSYTPRDIRDITKPPSFQYPIVVVNLLWVAAIAMMYAPIAPVVAIGATVCFWFSMVVYKYQLMYVYVSRAESGGRMWNVYVNRLLVCVILMQLLMVLTAGLVRQRWLDSVSAAPPVLIIIAFKIYLNQTVEKKFTHYMPTAQEAEQQRIASQTEKRFKHSDAERRFLHPALRSDKLYHVMVHKQQEGLAREVLSVYPWFNKDVKGVRVENLEYNPERDGPVDNAHKDQWDNRSIASTDMLTRVGSSDMLSRKGSTDMLMQPKELGYGYDTPLYATQSNTSFQPVFNPSTDKLLQDSTRSDVYAPPSRSNSRPMLSRNASDDAAPLLMNSAPVDRSAGGVPYPPSSYQTNPYDGGMRRQDSNELQRHNSGDNRYANPYDSTYAAGGYGDSYGRRPSNPRLDSSGSGTFPPAGQAGQHGSRGNSGGSSRDVYGQSPPRGYASPPRGGGGPSPPRGGYGVGEVFGAPQQPRGGDVGYGGRY